MKQALIDCAVRYDNKQAPKPGYNPYALPQYLTRIDEVCDDIAAGAPVRDAIVAGFTGRLAAAMLKTVKASPYTIADAVGGVFYKGAA
jgi:hypothetical protein